jgi:hypothetical protein
VLNATFSNISAISWRPVLVVEKTRAFIPERQLTATTDIDQGLYKILKQA